MAKLNIFFIAHTRNGHISASGQKSDITIVFSDPDLRCRNFGDSSINKYQIAYFYCACAKRPYFDFRSKYVVTVVFVD